jgi:CBS domain-containing protein
VGKGFALLFGVLGLFTMNFLLILVAWFVWAGARAEAQHAEMKEALASRRVADLLVPAPTVVDAKAPLSEAANALLVAHRSALPIVRDGRYAGMLLADDLPGHDEHTPVAEALRRTRPVRIDEPAWNALQAMETAGLPEIAVVDDEGAIAGMITREDAVRLLRLERLKAKSRLLDSSHPSTT